MDVIMPQLGETVAEGTVSVWHKAIGDTVSTKEPLFDVSSDKVEMEVPAPAEGTLLEIRVDVGITVPVGEVRPASNGLYNARTASQYGSS